MDSQTKYKIGPNLLWKQEFWVYLVAQVHSLSTVFFWVGMLFFIFFYYLLSLICVYFRFEYDVSSMGSREFTGYGKKFQRKDFEVFVNSLCDFF